MINKKVTTILVNRDFMKLIFMRKRIHKAINVIAMTGEIGMYFKKNETKTILPNNQ